MDVRVYVFTRAGLSIYAVHSLILAESIRTSVHSWIEVDALQQAIAAAAAAAAAFIVL
ncbi:unnamed protein product, partial [Ceratitis capitata]